MKRYPELELFFKRIDVDINGAKNAARNLDLNNLPRPALVMCCWDYYRNLAEIFFFAELKEVNVHAVNTFILKSTLEEKRSLDQCMFL